MLQYLLNHCLYFQVEMISQVFTCEVIQIKNSDIVCTNRKCSIPKINQYIYKIDDPPFFLKLFQQEVEVLSY